MTLSGTIYLTYLTNVVNGNDAPMKNSQLYQGLSLKGGSGSNTKIIGQLIVDALSLGGTSGITMTLDKSNQQIVRHVALVR